jgi:4'-phosphopantetheinyl transferase
MFAIKTSYLQLADNEVHVWCTSFDLPRLKLEEAPSLLTMEEHARAARFYFEKDRNQYLVRRCVLRMLLGGYINMQPARVQIDYGVNGKPGVKPLNDGSTLQFNLSHSYSQAIYAFSWNRQVGIDLEKILPIPDAERLAEHYFSIQENEMLRTFSGNHKWDAFYKIWTAKEAYLKAQGDGLAHPLNQVEISLPDGVSACLSSIDGDLEQAAAWRLQSFLPAEGYQSCLAVEGHSWRLAFQNFEEHFTL